jgi:tetratricopeptide (TPR) repeat protein
MNVLKKIFSGGKFSKINFRKIPPAQIFSHTSSSQFFVKNFGSENKSKNSPPDDENKCEKEQCGCHSNSNSNSNSNTSHSAEDPTLMQELKSKNYQIVECINLGKFKEAIELSDDYINKIKENFGDEHPFYCSAINNKAYVLKICGEYSEASLLFEEVIEKYIKMSGGRNNDKVLISMHNLATLYKDWGKFDKSLSMFEEILKIVEKSNLDTDLSSRDGKLKLNLIANIYNSAAGLYSRIQKYEESDRLFDLSYKIISTNFGENTLPIATVLNNIGLSLKDRGRFEEAMEKYSKALTIREELLAKDHPDITIIRHNIEKLKNEMELKNNKSGNKI